ncbi:MAG: hypothetical protein ACRDI2_01865 [Chloroflexota bacterium]
MVTVTAEDVRRVERIERELAAEGREAERAAVGKALRLLRAAAIERLEREVGASQLPPGRLPDAGEAPLRTLGESGARRLATLLEASQQGRLAAAERKELQGLLDAAEAGAMGNVLALVRQHAPNSDEYLGALRAYRRSFARLHRRAAGRGTGADSVSAGG